MRDLIQNTLKSSGPFGPYRQSERIPIYKKYAQKLLDRGLAYYDFREDLELEELRKKNRKNPQPLPRPESIPDPLTAQKRIQKGEKPALRFKVPDNFDFSIKDINPWRGAVTGKQTDRFYPPSVQLHAGL